MQLPDDMNLDKSVTAPIVHVDDDNLAIEIVKRYYRRSNVTNPYVCFNDGDSFLEDLRKSRDEQKELPLLVLLDVNMPGLDGFDVLKELRKTEEFKDIPLCSMLSSSTYEGDINKSIELGANGYIVKPDNAKEYLTLFNEIAAAVSGTG